MSVPISISYFFSSHKLCFLFILVMFDLCLSDQNYDDALCIDGERNALMQFKYGLTNEGGRLASWVGEKSDCCRWAGIVCDNNTGHVHEIRLRGLEYQRIGGNLSSSLLELKQLKHLDLSSNNFNWIQIPSFIGSLRNLRYLNLSGSFFFGVIPPQIGNLSELRVLSLKSYTYLSTPSLHWLSSLRRLHHLDMNYVDLSEAIDWFQVINTLPSLVQLHLSLCQLTDSHPYVDKLNLTSLSMLDISENDFNVRFVPQWIFSLTSLASLDLSGCEFVNLVPSSIHCFHNLTSLESLNVAGNDFMNSPLILKGLSPTLISLDIRSCGVSDSLLNSLPNFTSLLSLDVSGNQLTKVIPNSLCNFCSLRALDLSDNNFVNIDLTSLLNSFFNCKSPSLESLVISSSGLSGPIPYLIGRFSSLKKLDLHDNRLNGSLPNSLGQLPKLELLWLSDNMLTGIVTEVHFAKTVSLKFLYGWGNNLTMQVARNWIPPFQIQYLYLNSWRLGHEFPSWLQTQRDLVTLDVSNAGISSLMPPESFWRLFPNLTYLDISQNDIKGTVPWDILAKLDALYLNSNEFGGNIPSLSSGSLSPSYLDLSNNSFVGSLHHLLCSNGAKKTSVLNLGKNLLSGVIPECWDKWENLGVLILENNNFSGEIPRTLSSAHALKLLNIHGNKISGRIPTSLMNLTGLQILQLGRNELVGSIPSLLGTRLNSLRILNLRSNHLDGNIPHELCHLSSIQILDLAHNNLSGNIPTCFNNFSILSGKERQIHYFNFNVTRSLAPSDTLVMKGHEYVYTSLLGQLLLLDLASNNFSGAIPIELMALQEVRSLNFSRNRLTGTIPENIGDMKNLESLDLSLNKISGNLPMSMSRLTFLSSFNVSYNNLMGRVPDSTQLQSFGDSSFLGNKLCGASLIDRCVPVEYPSNTTSYEIEDNGRDWGLVISIVLGLIVGFWIIVAPLILSTRWRIAYFHLISKLVNVDM